MAKKLKLNKFPKNLKQLNFYNRIVKNAKNVKIKRKKLKKLELLQKMTKKLKLNKFSKQKHLNGIFTTKSKKKITTGNFTNIFKLYKQLKNLNSKKMPKKLHRQKIS